MFLEVNLWFHQSAKIVTAQHCTVVDRVVENPSILITGAVLVSWDSIVIVLVAFAKLYLVRSILYAGVPYDYRTPPSVEEA